MTERSLFNIKLMLYVDYIAAGIYLKSRKQHTGDGKDIIIGDLMGTEDGIGSHYRIAYSHLSARTEANGEKIWKTRGTTHRVVFL